jgi:hypothetical protein
MLFNVRMSIAMFPHYILYNIAYMCSDEIQLLLAMHNMYIIVHCI